MPFQRQGIGLGTAVVDAAYLVESTLNRLEHAPSGPSRYHKIGHDPAAIEGRFVALFLEAHKTPPKEILLDLDATDDPLHGHQEGRFFHGDYDCSGDLPLYIFCGRHLLAAKLRRANIDASAGAVEEVARIVDSSGGRWPRPSTCPRGGTRVRRRLAAGARDHARTLYEGVSCARGEIENRIKEQQLDLFADRTSAATMRANQLRLWFGSFAYLLVEALRRIGLRHTRFATATCGTIRLELLKIGAQVRRSVRRIKIAIASACPYQTEYYLACLYLKRARLLNASAQCRRPAASRGCGCSPAIRLDRPSRAETAGLVTRVRPDNQTAGHVYPL